MTCSWRCGASGHQWLYWPDYFNANKLTWAAENFDVLASNFSTEIPKIFKAFLCPISHYTIWPFDSLVDFRSTCTGWQKAPCCMHFEGRVNIKVLLFRFLAVSEPKFSKFWATLLSVDSNAVPHLSVTCFVTKTVAIKCKSSKKAIKPRQPLGPYFSGTGPQNFRRFVSEIYPYHLTNFG